MKGRGAEQVGDFPGRGESYSCRVFPGLGQHEIRGPGMLQLLGERVGG